MKADKAKIKNATDKELSDFINRTRRENEAFYLIDELKRRDVLDSETANKSLSIKEASDKELDLLIQRLRKENEAQNLIGDLKRKAGSDIPYDRPEVSTESPVNSMYHKGINSKKSAEYFNHTGIKGMRWGVRRTRSTPIAKQKQKKKSEVSEDYKKARVLKTKKISEMSDAELKALNGRLQLEKQYKDLSPKKLSSGKKFVNAVINQSATQVATKLVTGAALLAAKKIITDKYGDEIASAILAKKK